MQLESIKPGDILRGWHDSGAMGMEPIYYRAVKLGRVRVCVRCEHGDEGWMYPAAFDKKMDPTQVDFVVWK